jgi:hypothetical protein
MRKTISLDDGGNRDGYDNENSETIITVDIILIAYSTYENKAVSVSIVK